MLRTVAVFVLCLSTQDSQPVRDAFAPPATFNETTVSVGLNVPRPIREADLETYASWLALSEAQQLTVGHFYQTYREQVREAAGAAAPRLWELSRAAGEASLAGFGPDYAQRMKDFCEGETRLLSRLRQLDDAFFAEVDSIVSDEQRPKLQRVKSHRRRLTCDLRGTWPLLDLAEWLRQQHVDIESDAKIAAIMEAYEVEVTPRMVELDDRLRRTKADLAEKTVAIATAAKNKDEAGLKAATDARSRILRLAAKQERQVLEANGRYLARVCEWHGNGGVILQDNWRGLVYRAAFPDSLDPRMLIAEIAQRPDVDATATEAMHALTQQFEQSLDAVNAKIMKRIDDYREQLSSTLTGEGDQQYREDMRGLRQERWTMYLKFLDQLAAIAPLPPGSDLETKHKAYQELFRQTVETSQNDQFPSR